MHVILSIALKTILVVIEMHEMATVYHRMESNAVLHVKAHFTATPILREITSTALHTVTRPVIVMERAHAGQIGGFGEIIKRGTRRPAPHQTGQAAFLVRIL